MNDLQKLIAKDLLKIKAVFFRPEEPFTWASGIKSPVYCDNRLTLTSVEVRSDVENGLATLIKENYPRGKSGQNLEGQPYFLKHDITQLNSTFLH